MDRFKLRFKLLHCKITLLIALILIPLCAYGWGVVVSGGGGSAPTNPITYVNYSVISTDSSTDLVFSKPSGTATGDIAVVFLCTDSNGTTISTLPTGWTNYEYIAGAGHKGLVAYKIIDGDDGATITFVMSASQHQSGIMMVFNKTSGTWDIDQDYDEATFAATETADILPTMSATDNSVLVAGYVNDGSLSVSGNPDGMTKAGGIEAGVSASTVGYYQIYDAAASTGTKTATWGSADDCSALGLIIDVAP